MVQHAQERAADFGAAAAVPLFGITWTVTGVLQFVALVLTVICAGFSLYFHIKRFLRERKESK